MGVDFDPRDLDGRASHDRGIVLGQGGIGLPASTGPAGESGIIMAAFHGVDTGVFAPG